MAHRLSVHHKFRSQIYFEELEAREVLSAAQPTVVEQLFLERLNDARANPAAYGVSIGLDLSGVAPSQPLAFNSILIDAAREHAQDMNNRAYFSHDTPEGTDPGTRIAVAGYDWHTWGESLAGGTAFPGPDEALRALIIDSGVPDLGHRKHLLAIDDVFKGQTEVGIGILQMGTGPLVNYHVVDSAAGWTPQSFLTGVVINDANQNGQYDIGEGLGGVTITASGAGSTTTFGSGGYALPLSAGTYQVTASGGGLPAPVTRTVTIGSSNVRITFTTGGVVQALPPAPEAYVSRLYQSILGRDASSAELAPWVSVYQGPAGPAGVVSGIEQSVEARSRLVRSWYTTYLGRAAGDGEVRFWVNGLLHGAREEDIVSGIIGSEEYRSHAASQKNPGAPDTAFVSALYQQLLNRTASAQEISGWLQAVRQAGRAAVALGFLQSTEYRSNVVQGFYIGLLKRSAGPALSEIAFWAASRLPLSQLRQAFEASQEYYVRS